MKLTIELVPKGLWYTNLRSELPKEDWDRLRHAAYRKADYHCETCGGQGPQWPVECHERWEYDDQHRIQKLVGLMALCPNCHRVKHYGRTQLMGEEELALAHLMKVNDITREEALTYVNEVIEVWRRRSQHEWKQDLSWLDSQKGE